MTNKANNNTAKIIIITVDTDVGDLKFPDSVALSVIISAAQIIANNNIIIIIMIAT